MELSPNLKKLLGMAEGLKELPESAAGPKQKPVPEGFGWKPSEAETQRDIELDKMIAPIQREEFMKAYRARTQKPPATTQEQLPALPTEDEMKKMGHMDLLALRQGRSKKEQDIIAPYEHRAFAREYVKENPESAISMLGMVLGYGLAKEVGLAEGRSSNTGEAIWEGVKGTVEGIGGAVREGAKQVQENYEQLKEDLTWKPLPSESDLWEQGKKNGEDFKKKVRGM